MKYNEKYDLFLDDDLVIYYWNKITNKLMQCKISKNPKGYLCVCTKLGVRFVHRVIWETFRYEIPDGMQLDHINTIRSDNRLENLRCVTQKENSNNPLTRKHISEVRTGNFKIKFDNYCKEHNVKLNYKTEYSWYSRYNKTCRWEK